MVVDDCECGRKCTAMKRVISAVCLVLIISLLMGASSTGEEAISAETEIHVYFGRYEQDNDSANGPEPIEWRVLDQKDDGSLLLISEYGLDVKPFISPINKVIWEKCTLRKWLNKEFLSAAFTKEEQKSILKVKVDNSAKQGNDKYVKFKQSDTTDQVFVLSYAEAEVYFPEEKDRLCAPTEYAKAQGAFVNDTNGKCVWWLRSPGSYLNWATRVNHFGVLGTATADNADNCVRPVIWVRSVDAVSEER